MEGGGTPSPVPVPVQSPVPGPAWGEGDTPSWDREYTQPLPQPRHEAECCYATVGNRFAVTQEDFLVCECEHLLHTVP